VSRSDGICPRKVDEQRKPGQINGLLIWSFSNQESVKQFTKRGSFLSEKVTALGVQQRPHFRILSDVVDKEEAVICLGELADRKFELNRRVAGRNKHREPTNDAGRHWNI
jgi:hypothetical protein